MSSEEEKGIDIFRHLCLTNIISMKGGDNMKGLRKFAYILIIIGALNWGLVGFFGFNAVNAIFASIGLENIVYMLVGLSGVLMLTNWGKK